MTPVVPIEVASEESRPEPVEPDTTARVDGNLASAVEQEALRRATAKRGG